MQASRASGKVEGCIYHDVRTIVGHRRQRPHLHLVDTVGVPHVHFPPILPLSFPSRHQFPAGPFPPQTESLSSTNFTNSTCLNYPRALPTGVVPVRCQATTVHTEPLRRRATLESTCTLYGGCPAKTRERSPITDAHGPLVFLYPQRVISDNGLFFFAEQPGSRRHYDIRSCEEKDQRNRVDCDSMFIDRDIRTDNRFRNEWKISLKSSRPKLLENLIASLLEIVFE